MMYFTYIYMCENVALLLVMYVICVYFECVYM